MPFARAHRSVLPAVLVLATAGCSVTTPEPLPDPARASGVLLLASPASLVIRPSGSGRIHFQVRDEAHQALAYYPVDFRIVPVDLTVVENGQDTTGARLSTLHSLTDLDGETVVEVIVGPLANADRPVVFAVEATCPGAPAEQAAILVTTNAYSVEVLPVPADDLLGLGPVGATRLYFYDNAACADIDLYDIGSSFAQARLPPQLVPANTSFVFQGVAAAGVHAVVGLGLDSAQSPVIGGCVDIAGAALLEDETMRATLLLDHLFPALSGSFAVSSDFQLNPPPLALAGLRSAWQQWQRCPYDPARLWLDCTLAALGPDPSSCGPSPGPQGTLANLVSASRGTVLPSIPATSASETPCRGPADSAGNPSLEVAVDALFTNTRAQLAAAALGGFPAELATLLNDVRLTSRLALSPARDANTYWARHELLAVAFPDATSPIPPTFSVEVLALPVPTAAGILATFKAGQLSFPDHGFTLRLGTAARYAFEAASLDARNAKNIDTFVEAVFSLAQLADGHDALAGCAAFDAIVCDQIRQARGCLADACQAGLILLGKQLAGAFDNLDGFGLDFHLSGSAPVIDANADGRADALGTTGITGGVAVGPGLWSAVIEARAGIHVTYGSWLGARDSTGP